MKVGLEMTRMPRVVVTLLISTVFLTACGSQATTWSESAAATDDATAIDLKLLDSHALIIGSEQSVLANSVADEYGLPHGARWLTVTIAGTSDPIREVAGEWDAPILAQEQHAESSTDGFVSGVSIDRRESDGKNTGVRSFPLNLTDAGTPMSVDDLEASLSVEFGRAGFGVADVAFEPWDKLVASALVVVTPNDASTSDPLSAIADATNPVFIIVRNRAGAFTDAYGYVPQSSATFSWHAEGCDLCPLMPPTQE
jgi:hypothetical protein